MSKELIDRLDELLIINASLRVDIKELKEAMAEMIEEILENREKLDNKDYWR